MKSGQGVGSYSAMVLALTVVVLASTPLGPHAGRASAAIGLQSAALDLAPKLNAILADPRLTGAQVGVVVREATTGRVLYEHDAAARLIPGSNQKLLVASAAFAVLGPAYRFRTVLLTGGRVQGDLLDGNLYLKGTGDPTMLSDRYAGLAASLQRQGIRRVRGRLIADDTWFDRVRLGPDWTWDDEGFAFAAQVSALTVSPNEDFDAGTVIVDVRPGAAVGAPARVLVTPATRYIAIDNQVTTAAPGSSSRLTVDREHGTNRIVLRGSLAVDASGSRHWVSVWEPTGYAAEVFRAALVDQGIVVDGPTTFGASPLRGRELAALESVPLAQLAVPFLKLSNNGIAEALVKAVGRQVFGEGSWSAGLQVVSDFLAARGTEGGAIRLRDGSGLSRLNLISARELTNLLVSVQREPWFASFYDALPIAGASERLVGGTLRSRMQATPADHNVHAKTGTLTGVSALSGYVTGAAGQRFVFSILMNNFIGPAPRDLEDAIAVTLARAGSD